MLGVLGAEEVCVCACEKEAERRERHFLRMGSMNRAAQQQGLKPSLEEFSTWFFFKDATLNCSEGEKERREETEEVENVREPHT